MCGLGGSGLDTSGNERLHALPTDQMHDNATAGAAAPERNSAVPSSASPPGTPHASFVPTPGPRASATGFGTALLFAVARDKLLGHAAGMAVLDMAVLG